MKYVKRTIALVIILAAIGMMFSLPGTDDTITMYRTDKVTRGNITEIVSASGTLNPIELVTIGSQVSGQIQQVHVKVNDEVKKGQLLAEIDPSIVDTQLKQSRSSMETSRIAFEQAARDLERTKSLVAKEFIAKVELERSELAYRSAKNSYESAKLQVEQDEVNLGYTKITSPIDGIVISQEISQGQTLAANFQTPNLFKIAGDLTKMKIDVNLPESDITKVKKGMPVTFTVDAFPDDEFSGVVETVNLNPTTESGVVTYSVVVTVENAEKKLLPGMTAYVSVTLSEIKDVLRVPAAATRFQPPLEQITGFRRLFSFGMRSRSPRFDETPEPTVYLLKNDRPVAIKITIGATDQTYVEISGEGIAENDDVIVGIQPVRNR